MGEIQEQLSQQQQLAAEHRTVAKSVRDTADILFRRIAYTGLQPPPAAPAPAQAAPMAQAAPAPMAQAAPAALAPMHPQPQAAPMQQPQGPAASTGAMWQ